MNMRKIAFVAFAAALGLAAQGETLYWCVTGIKSSPTTTVGDKTYLAYIFADTDSGPDKAMIFSQGYGENTRVTRDTIKTMLANKEDVTKYAFRNASIVSTDNVTYSADRGRLNSYDATTQTGSYLNEVAGWIGEGGYVDLFAVILDGTTWSAASNYMFLETSAEGMIYTYNNKGHSDTFNFGSQANNTWYAIGTAIPEPTSGLLLVLGMATLALKRKRA